ncbi:response regulator [Halosquirtibacter xylanolyticus]|uniref:hybrid sensor histidine kinase/response regulator transcription factor n=1 Tax=Halosquirtibacter xylanolyticus TaxID=3374599 RepID=UPI003748FC2F|nr:response regulator [Prolixibacteraceae bacterium]
MTITLRNARNYIYCLCLFITCFTPKLSLSQNISFKKIGLEDGLSELSGLCIHQDHLGRMWFGTRDGLNCWDGSKMKTFYPILGDSTTISGHKVLALRQTDKYLWALTGTTVSRLDLETLQFKRYPFVNIMNIGTYNGTLLLATTHGILVYNKLRKVFEKSAVLANIDVKVRTFYQDRDYNLWLVSSNKKLIRVSDDQEEYIDIPIEGRLEANSIYVDTNKCVWIATRYHGLLQYNTKTKMFQKIDLHSSPFHLNSMSVRSVVEDSEKRLWIGTFKGLVVFDLKNKSTKTIDSNRKGSHQLSHNSIYSIYLSRDNNIWVGTYFGGINYGRVENKVFKQYEISSDSSDDRFQVMGDIVEDKDHNLWIATEGAGLLFYDTHKKEFEHYPSGLGNKGVARSNIKSLQITNNNQLLVGNYMGGLSVLDIKKRRFKHFNKTQSDKFPLTVFDIIPYDGTYLLATEGGVIQFDPNNEQFKSYPFKSDKNHLLNAKATMLFIDSYDILWVAGARGLFAYDLFNGELRKYFTTNNKGVKIRALVNEIVEDRYSNLWVATDGVGLCLYHRNQDRFTVFDRKNNQLPSDFVYGMELTKKGNLWISTSKGLSLLDISDSIFYNYTASSGLPLRELNYKSLLYTKNRELFIGGIDGLISINETDLLQKNQHLKVNLSSLSVNNKEVRANDDSKILSRDIAVVDRFTLEPEHTVFTIGFTSFNYNNALNNKFQYKLEGFDQKWVNAEYMTTATYTNIDPGQYTFKVRATDVAYNPITDTREVAVVILPPLSQTWGAYMVYGIIVLLILFILHRIYLSRLKLQYQIDKERDEKENIKTLNQHKLRFFTNISHEFMTPLTIILCSLESLYKDRMVNDNQDNQLDAAYRNAKRLKNLSSELLDFRKIEQGHLKLAIKEQNMVTSIYQVFESFRVVAKNKNITYQLNIDVPECNLYYDEVQMDKVFYNLISNAIKHVKEYKGVVSIHLKEFEDKIAITVQDNGEGIPEADIDKIFHRFYHHESKYTHDTYSGIGIGLALTHSIVKAHHGTIKCMNNENNGASFTIFLDRGCNHFEDHEITVKSRPERSAIDLPIPINIEEAKTIHKPMRSNLPLLLIVDDNPEIRTAVTNIFIDNYNVRTADDGTSGLAMALDLQPDIIISDILMPKMSGFEMTEKLKRNLNTSHIPILLLTCLNTDEDHIEAFKKGADTYCTKPFDAEMLKVQVNNLFDNRRKVQEGINADPQASLKSITRNIVDSEFLSRMTDIVEANLLNQNFNVDEFAAEMKLGRTIFYRKVKSITGQTPNEYILTIRLKKAADLIVNDITKNVSEISYDTGFSSPRYFSIAFKKHFGVSPSKYVR